MKQKKPRILAAILLCLLAVGVLFGVYVGDYYHADAAAEAALLSDEQRDRHAGKRQPGSLPRIRPPPG